MYNAQTQKDLPVSILTDDTIPCCKISSHYDRFNEYGILVALSEEELREGIKNFPRAGYSSTIGRPYKRGSFYHATYEVARSCD